MARVTRRKFFQLFGLAAVSPKLVSEAAAKAARPIPEPWRDQMWEIVPAGTDVPYSREGYDRAVYELRNPDLEDDRVFWLVPLDYVVEKDGNRLAERKIFK
jgi:hypothetical protein